MRGRKHVFKSPARTLKFSHQQHLALGNVAPALAAAIDSGTYLSPTRPAESNWRPRIGCMACHRGLAENDATGPANHPQMADCLVCHTTIDAPFSCELCHTADAKIKPVSHTSNFIDLHSSRNAKLDKPSCKICHGVGFRRMGVTNLISCNQEPHTEGPRKTNHSDLGPCRSNPREAANPHGTLICHPSARAPSFFPSLGLPRLNAGTGLNHDQGGSSLRSVDQFQAPPDPRRSPLWPWRLSRSHERPRR